MESVTNAASAAANTVTRAIWGDSSNTDHSDERSQSNKNMTSVTSDEPRNTHDSVHDSNPFRHTTGPEHTSESPYASGGKGELSSSSGGHSAVSTGLTGFDNKGTGFDNKDTGFKATDPNPNNPFLGTEQQGIGKTEKSNLGLTDHSSSSINPDSTLGNPQLGSYSADNAHFGGARPDTGSHALNKPENRTALRDHSSSDVNMDSTLGNPKLGSYSSDNAHFGGARPSEHSTEHGNTLGKTELRDHSPTDINKQSTLGKTELGSYSADNAHFGGARPSGSDHSSHLLGKTEDRRDSGNHPIASSEHERRSNVGLSGGLPHSSSLTGDNTHDRNYSKPSSSHEPTGQIQLNQPSATSNVNAPLSSVAGAIGSGPGAAVEPSVGARPLGDDDPSRHHQGTNRPLDEPSDHKSSSFSPSRAPRPMGSGLEGGTIQEEGTGDKYEKSTGLAADGGDFDATRPGAGREADRLLEEKGIHRQPGGSTKLHEEQAKKDSAATHTHESSDEHKGLAAKIKEKLHIGH